jgi:hypothetical protein
MQETEAALAYQDTIWIPPRNNALDVQLFSVQFVVPQPQLNAQHVQREDSLIKPLSLAPAH